MFMSKANSYLQVLRHRHSLYQWFSTCGFLCSRAPAQKLLAMPALGFSLCVLTQKLQGAQHCLHKACREADAHLGLRATGYSVLFILVCSPATNSKCPQVLVQTGRSLGRPKDTLSSWGFSGFSEAENFSVLSWFSPFWRENISSRCPYFLSVSFTAKGQIGDLETQ